jgi:hypothetical protein
MATENNTEGFSPLDNLGSSYGDLNLPDTPQSMLPFEGDRIQMPEINFPGPDSFTPVMPQFDKLSQEQLNIKRNVVGTPPGKPGSAKGTSTKDVISGFGDYIHGNIKANQDKNTYARIYQYDSGSQGSSYYKRYAAYGQETFDKIGFTPIRDNEASFNAGTTGWDDFQRMISYSFIPLVGMGFTTGPKSLMKALGGDFGADLDEARAYEDATAIGYSSKGGAGAFFNNALMNFGYTAGIIGEVMAEELVLGAITGLSGGVASGVAASRTAGNIARIGKGFSQAFYMDRVANVAGKALTSLKNTQAARSFWKAANTPLGKFFNPLSNTFEAVNNVSKISKFDNLTGLAKLSKTAGGFYADVRNLNAALSEGRLEGGLVENNMYDRIYNDHWERTGKAPTDKEDYEMRKMAKDASKETIAWNTGLVYFSNNLTFGNILKPKGGMRRLLAGKTEELMRTAEGRIVAESTKIAGGKAIQAEAKYIQKTFKDSWKAFKDAPVRKILGAAGTYSKANVVEGLQENAQETISEATQNYYTDLYNSEAVKSHLFARAAQTNGMRSKFSYYSDAWEEQNPFTDKGFETFATGFVMGIFGGGMNMIPGFVSKSYNKMYRPEEYQKYLDGKNKYGEQLAATLNNNLFKDPIKVFDQRLLNLAIQEQAGKVKTTGSRKLTTDVTDDAFTSAVITAMMTNSIGAFKEQIESYKNLTDVEFEDAFKIEKGQGQKYLGKIDSVLQRINEIEADYEENMDRYPDPIDLTGYKKGTEAYNKAAIYLSAWRTARNNAIFLGQTNKNAKKRMDQIANTVRSKKPLSKMSDTELMVLFDTDRLTSEIGMLKTEIESSQGLISAAELKKKQRVLASMQELQNKVEYYYRYDNAELESHVSSQKEKGVFKNTTDDDGNILDEQEAEERYRDILRKKFNVKEKSDQNTTRAESDLEVAYKEYLKAISDVRKDEYLERNADDAFEYILDRYRLGRESSTLNKYVNLLYNPKEFMNHVERNYAWMSKAYENRREFYDSLVKQELNDIELNALLNELANKNIYVSADDIYEFRRNNKIPDEFFDDSRKVVIRRGSPEYEQYAFLFMQAVKLKEFNPNAKKNINERIALELTQLSAQEQQELGALPQKEQRKERGDLDKLGNETVKLSEVVNQLQNGDTLSAFYLVDGQPTELIVYRDGDQIKFNDRDGEIIDVAQLPYDIVDGKIFTIQMVSADAIAAQKIKDKFALKREEAIRKAIADVEATPQVRTEEFVPFTVNTPLDQLDRALYTDLQVAFNDFLAETDEDGNPVHKDENGEPLIEVYSRLTDEQLLEKFEEFVRDNPEAKKVIEEYNAEMQGRKLEEQAVNIIPPIIEYNGREVDMADVSLEEAKRILADLESQLASKQKEDLTNEEKEDLLADEYNIAYLRRYIADVEAFGEASKITEKPFSSEAEQLAAETATRKRLAEQALERRIKLVEEKRMLIEKEEAEITDTLDYLQQLLDNTVELTGVQVEDLINKIAQLDKTTAQLLKANQKKRSGLIKERSSLYKKQLRREFGIANDIMNRVRELKQQQEQLNAIKRDLKKQADYYRNLIADPKFDLFSKTDIRNKIQRIEKKMNTIQRLIEILRSAIANSMEYLKEYLNIWKKQNKALSSLKKDTGYKELSAEEINQLIKATDNISKMKIEGYTTLKSQVNQLERDLNDTMDNVEFIDEVREQEQNRMMELEGALQKYQDQLRYLNDLLDPVAQDIVEEPLSNEDIITPAPTEVRTQTVEELFAEEEETTIISTFSLADIADLDTALSEKTTRPLTLQEQRLDSVRSTIRDVLKNASFIKLSEDGTKYINTKTGKEYMRVTSYTKESDIKDPMLSTESLEDYAKRLKDLGYNDRDINSKLKLASSTVLGNATDEYIRDFFSGKLKESSKYTWAPVEEIEKFNKKLTEIKAVLDSRSEIVLANNVVLYNDELGLAGTVDLLTFDRNGDVRIYDIKTMLGNNFAETYQDDNVVKYESKRFGKSKRQQHTEQLSVYRILLNNTHGLKAKTLAVLPIALDYDAGGKTTRTIDVLSGVEITPMDAVGPTAVLVEQNSSTQQAQASPQAATGIKVVTGIQKELRNQLNLMGYSNTTIDLLPKSEIEYIVKNGITKEQYSSRVVTQAMTDTEGRFWALPGDPIFISSITDKGIFVTKVNGKSPIFITFKQLTSQTQMSTAIKPQAPVVKQDDDTQNILQESSDLAKDVIKAEINSVEDRIKDAELGDLESTLFNAPIC